MSLSEKLWAILNEGNDPNIKGDSGWTPLHNAVKEGQLEVVEVHLVYGPDPNAKEDTELTPLTSYDAIWTRHFLLEYWADPNAIDKYR